MIRRILHCMNRKNYLSHVNHPITILCPRFCWSLKDVMPPQASILASFDVQAGTLPKHPDGHHHWILTRHSAPNWYTRHHHTPSVILLVAKECHAFSRLNPGIIRRIQALYPSILTDITSAPSWHTRHHCRRSYTTDDKVSRPWWHFPSFSTWTLAFQLAPH